MKDVYVHVYLAGHKNKCIASDGAWLFIFEVCARSLFRRYSTPSDDLKMLHGRIAYPVQNRMRTYIRVDTYIDTLTYFKS